MGIDHRLSSLFHLTDGCEILEIDKATITIDYGEIKEISSSGSKRKHHIYTYNSKTGKEE